MGLDFISYINRLKERKALILLIGIALLLVGFLGFVFAYRMQDMQAELMGFGVLLIGLALSIVGYIRFTVGIIEGLKSK
jgi:uncharacterized membrane protein YedE/YeeE